MARGKGRPEAILDSIAKRLRRQVPGLNEANCYWSIDPDALPAGGPGDFVYVVSPMSGQFDEGMFDGGGIEQMTANGGIGVRIHSPLNIDQTHRDEESLMSPKQRNIGLLPMMSRVLRALAGWSPGMSTSDDDTDYGDENGITRDPLLPAGYAFGKNATSPPTKWGEVSFRMNFDWDSSEPEEA